MNMPPTVNRSPPAPPVAMVVLLLILAVLLMVEGVLLGVVALVVAAEAKDPSLLQVLMAVGFIVGGCGGACVLWGAAWMVRRLHELWLLRGGGGIQEAEMVSDEGPRTAPLPQVILVDPERDEVAPAEPPTLQQVLAELKELKTNTLLSPEQREAKRLREQTRRVEEQVSRVRKAIQDRDFRKADALAEQLDEEMPDESRRAALKKEIADAQEAIEAADVARATQRVDDLMAVASFVEALQAAEELLAGFPQSAQAAALVERVRREGTSFTRDHRRRLYAEIELYAQNRRWRQALAAAKRFVEAHPNCSEAELVRTQMPTLDDNARIEEVRDMRDRILDYIERRRYQEAVELAREVMERFPETAAAQELQQQVLRWMELARPNQGNWP